MRATGGPILFRVCKHALLNKGIEHQSDDETAVMVWTDAIRKLPFAGLKPWQIVNRIPFANTLCRKAPFVLLVNRICTQFPEVRVIPPSWVLPYDTHEFNRVRLETRKTYICKPDRGSLGYGIRLLHAEEPFEVTPRLVVAQEYIDCYLIDERKFDLRVYAMITSVQPLEIYVHRGGVARFCTEPHNEVSRFGFLTNTAVNTRNRSAEEGSMTKTVGEVMEILASRGVKTSRLWRKIENVVVVALLSGLNFMERCDLPTPYGMSRCYQIFGCDVLLDTHLQPYVLELNHRPSLKANTDGSYAVKLKMLGDALQLVTPPETLQTWVSANPAQASEPPADIQRMARRRRIRRDNEFHRVYPNPHVPIFQRIADFVRTLPTELSGAGRVPLPVDVPGGSWAGD